MNNKPVEQLQTSQLLAELNYYNNPKPGGLTDMTRKGVVETELDRRVPAVASSDEHKLLGFMLYLRDHDRKPGVLAEHEMLAIIRDYLTVASLKS